MKKRKWIILALCGAVLLAALGIFISAEQSKNDLCLSSYTLRSPKITEPVRIVQLSDLHSAQFGEGNSRLIELVGAQKPDLIFLTGDLVTQDEEDTAVAAALILELQDIAPVYASLGNHELSHESRFGVDITALYEAAGAVVLEQSYLDLTVNGQAIRLGGLYGYCLPEKDLATHEARPDECDFLNAFQDTQRYTILLSHNPTGWLINGSLDAWQVDCVFAGHTHGGQIVLPFLGGVYGPDLGWFPGKLAGTYLSGDGSKTLVLSRGLGSSIGIPRVNNIPEVVVVELRPNT